MYLVQYLSLCVYGKYSTLRSLCKAILAVKLINYDELRKQSRFFYHCAKLILATVVNPWNTRKNGYSLNTTKRMHIKT